LDVYRLAIRYVAWVYEKAATLEGLHRAARDQWLRASQSIAVAARYGCESQDLLRRHRRGDQARQVLLDLAATCCRGRHSLTEIGQWFGGLPVGGVCSGRYKYKMAQRLLRDRPLAANVAMLQQGLAAKLKA
jgi:hypothetical protein